MAVTGTIAVENSLYTPFQTRMRGGAYGEEPVGTLSVDGVVTGAAGGGTAKINITMKRIEFGMVVMFVPTIVVLRDGLATAEDVQFNWVNSGNIRTNVEFLVRVEMVDTIVTQINAGKVDPAGILIEGVDQTERFIAQVSWATNTDTIVYELHMFGLIYDAEVIAKRGGISQLMAGIR